MTCPKCSYELSVQSRDASTDSYSGKPVEKTVYLCSFDKTRITVEMPTEEKKD